MRRRTILIQVEVMAAHADGLPVDVILDAVSASVEDAYAAQPSEPDTVEAMLYKGSLISDFTEELA